MKSTKSHASFRPGQGKLSSCLARRVRARLARRAEQRRVGHRMAPGHRVELLVVQLGSNADLDNQRLTVIINDILINDSDYSD